MTMTVAEMQERIRTGQFDSLTDLKLNVDAYRIHLKHTFDPVSVASIGKIDPLPHQVEAFVRMMAMLRTQSGISGRIRMLLADDVGLGKTIMVGLVMKELLLRHRINRVLIICPSGLQPQWQDELKEKFNEDFTIIRGQIEGNPYADTNRAIISVDIGRNEEKTKLLLSTQWDLVIVDEAHKLKPGNIRYGIAQEISTRTTHFILASATPHDGKIENFLGLVKLIDQDLENVHDSGELKEYLEPLMIRRLKEDIVNFRGKKIFPKRSIPRTIEIAYSPEELDFYNGVEDYVRTYYQKAENSGLTSVILALYILHRRVSSSIAAGVISLKTRRGNLLKPYLDLDTEKEREYLSCIDEGNEVKKEQAEEALIGATASVTSDELRQELAQLDILIAQGEDLLTREQDRKFQQLKKLLNQIRIERPEDKTIIFTEFTDTLKFLEQELTKENYLITKITGSLSPEERKQQARLFEKRAQILLGTEAAGEGLNLQFANIAINYELPWNPNRLEQRTGRVYRYGQKKEVFIYNFKTAFPIDEAVMNKILEKIENIRAIYGSNTIDVIGSIISEKEILEIFRLAQSRGSAVDKVDQLFTEKLEVFKEIEQFFIKDTFNLVNVTSLTPDISRCINNFDIERFFLTWAESNRNIDAHPAGENLYSIRIPCTQTSGEIVCAHREPQKYLEMTVTGVFNPDVKGTYLALGHPVISCAIDDAIAKQSCALIRYPERGILLTYVIRFYNELGKEIYAEPVLVRITEKETAALDPLAIWEMGGDAGDAPQTVDRAHYQKLFNDAVTNPELALHEYLPPLETFVRNKNEKDLEREFNFIYSEFNWKIKNQQNKKEKYLEAGQNYLIETVETRIQTLKKEYREILQNNNRAKNISWKLCGPVNLALLVPPEKHAPEPLSEEERIRVEKLKKEIELKGMDIVMEWERNHGREPQDVSKETVRGYDILSKSKNELRHIEVKSFSTTNPIQISSNEWRVASQLREDYYLYVIENISSDPDPTPVPIPDPYTKLAPFIKKITIEDFKMVLDKVPSEYYPKKLGL